MAQMYCPNCESVGNPKMAMKGSFIGELAFWLLFGLIGLVLFFFTIIGSVLVWLIPIGYSLSRGFSRTKVCPVCKQPGMVPLDSPRAKKALG